MKFSKLLNVNSYGMPGLSAALKAADRMNSKGGMASVKRIPVRAVNPSFCMYTGKPSGARDGFEFSQDQANDPSSTFIHTGDQENFFAWALRVTSC